MTINVQDAFAGMIVAVAALYVLRRVVRLIRPAGQSGGCGSGCGSCSATSSQPAPGTVTTVTIAPLKTYQPER